MSDWRAEQEVLLERFLFRIRAVSKARNNKYVLLNAPNEKLPEIIRLLPGMKSPTVLPLAEAGWSSVHSVLSENDFWDIIEKLTGGGCPGYPGRADRKNDRMKIAITDIRPVMGRPGEGWGISRPVIDLHSLEQSVAGILEEVRRDGDAAVRKYSLLFDKTAADPVELGAAEIEAGAEACRGGVEGGNPAGGRQYPGLSFTSVAG